MYPVFLRQIALPGEKIPPVGHSAIFQTRPNCCFIQGQVINRAIKSGVWSAFGPEGQPVGFYCHGYSALYSGGTADYLIEDTELYMDYLEENDLSPKLVDGIYQLQTEAGNFLQCSASGEIGLCLSPDDSRTEIRVVNYQGITRISFAANQYLTMADNSDPEQQIVSANASSRAKNQQWKVEVLEDGAVCILYDGENALTYDENNGSVYAAPYMAKANQKWQISAH